MEAADSAERCAREGCWIEVACCCCFCRSCCRCSSSCLSTSFAMLSPSMPKSSLVVRRASGSGIAPGVVSGKVVIAEEADGGYTLGVFCGKVSMPEEADDGPATPYPTGLRADRFMLMSLLPSYRSISASQVLLRLNVGLI